MQSSDTGACDTVLCGIAQPQRAVLLDGELDTVGYNSISVSPRVLPPPVFRT
jgi:hypothetical protein